MPPEATGSNPNMDKPILGEIDTAAMVLFNEIVAK
jgi:hypothetical protein